MFSFMDWVAYQWGRYGCSSPSTKVLHGAYGVQESCMMTTRLSRGLSSFVPNITCHPALPNLTSMCFTWFAFRMLTTYSWNEVVPETKEVTNILPFFLNYHFLGDLKQSQGRKIV